MAAEGLASMQINHLQRLVSNSGLCVCSRALMRWLASAVLRLKRIDSLPVSTM